MDPFFGIDIASENFVAFNQDQKCTTWSNKAQAIGTFLRTLPKDAVLAIEATGGYGKLLADKAFKAGFTVYILQPAKVKRYREASPQKGKTDRIDAVAIHDYVITYQRKLHAYEPLPEFEAQLRKLTRTRDGLVRKHASLRKQLQSLGDSAKAIDTTLAGLGRRIRELTEQVQAMLDSAPDAKVLTTITCVKATVIATVLPVLRTIPFKDKYALDSFAGMDLKPNESGKFKGRRRMSKQGDKHIRRAVYMAALSGTRAKAWKTTIATSSWKKSSKRFKPSTPWQERSSTLSTASTKPKNPSSHPQEVDNQP